MTTNYPGAIDNFTNPGPTDYEDVVSHSGQHTNANDAIEAIETVLGTTAGTAVIKDFQDGDFAVRQNAAGTLSQTLGLGTITSGSVSVSSILDEDDMSSNSATALATQQSIKAYVDANAGAGGKYVFIIPGNAVVGNDVAGTWFTPGAGAITSVDLFADTAGATGNTVVDILLDGTTIFPSTAKPTLADTAVADVGNIPDTTAFTASQKVTVDITGVTTTPQTDLYVVIKYSE